MAERTQRPGRLTKPQRIAWASLFVAHSLILQRIEADLEAAKVGSLTDYEVLYTLYEAEGRRMRLAELADTVLISRSGLTRLIDRLETRNLLRREACPSDRRGSFAALTEEGIEELRRIWAVYSEGIATYFAADLSPDELETIRSAFSRISANMRRRKRA